MKLISKKNELAGQLLPLSIARMLWKRKLLIIGLTVAISAASIMYVLTLPRIYRSESVVLVDAQKIPEKFVTSTVQVGLQDSLNAISQQVLNTNQLMVIVKELNLYPAERRTKLNEEILALMRDDLRVRVEKGFADGKSGAFRISYEGPDPVADQKVVQRISDLFIKENLKNREQRSHGASDFIEEELREAKTRLDTQEASMTSFKLTHVGELPQQEASLLGQLSRLQMELQVNQDSINRARQSQSMLETTLRLAESHKGSLERSLAQQRQMQAAIAASTAQGGGQSVAPMRPPDPLVSERLRAQLDSLRLRYHPTHPEVRRVQAELDQAVTAEARAEALRPPAPVNQTKDPEPTRVIATVADLNTLSTELRIENERATTTKAQIEVLEKEIQTRDRDTVRVQGQLAEYQKHVDTLPVREQEMAGLTRDYQNSKLNYQSLLDKKQAADMANHMEATHQSEGFTIADPPQVSDVPVKPNRKMLGFMSVIGSLAFGLLLALALELRNDHLLGEWELPAGVPVLGRIPRVGEGA